MDFKGKVILITGASSGIGADTAIHFAKLGASLALVGRNEKNLQKVINKSIAVSVGQQEPLAVLADITKDAERIIIETINTFGQLNVLVNNGGIGSRGTLQTDSIEELDRMMNTNVRSVYQLTKLALPHLVKTKGNIVNVSSTSGIKSNPNNLTYSMSKSALDQLTKCCALDFAQYGVRVNSVNPALIITEFHNSFGMAKDVYEKLVNRSSKIYPLQRIGKPEDVAPAIAFLASDSASFLTGLLMPVDGGMSITCPH